MFFYCIFLYLSTLCTASLSKFILRAAAWESSKKKLIAKQPWLTKAIEKYKGKEKSNWEFFLTLTF